MTACHRAELLKAQRELIQNELATVSPKGTGAGTALKVGNGWPSAGLWKSAISNVRSANGFGKTWMLAEQTDVRGNPVPPLPDSECNPRVKTRYKSACYCHGGDLEQEKFWSSQRRLENQRDLEPSCGTTGLDMRAFSSCLEEPGTQERLQADIEEAIRLGVKGTPTMIVNGYLLSGALSPEGFQLIADVAAIPKATK